MQMMNGSILLCGALAAVTLTLSWDGYAADARQARSERTVAVVQLAQTETQPLANKLKLLTIMVTSSPAAQRIEASEHSTEAKALLVQAREAHEQAQHYLEQGQLDAAERFLDEGLRVFGTAARTVTNRERAQAGERKRYADLQDRIASFRTAFASIVAEKGAMTATVLDATALQARLDQADALQQEQRYQEANLPLSQALTMLEQALAEVRAEETLVRTLEFASPEAEYAYEVERNRSYEMLVKLMLSEASASAASRTMIAQFSRRNDTARVQAETLAAAGDAAAALEALEGGTQQLVRALRLTGLPF